MTVTATMASSVGAGLFPPAIGQLGTAGAPGTLGQSSSGPVDALAATVTMLPPVPKDLLGDLRIDLKSIAAAIGQGSRNLPRVMQEVAAAAKDLVSPTMYFFEQVLVITPESAEAALRYRVNRYMPYGIIEVSYADPAGFDGLYVLYIQVERIP